MLKRVSAAASALGRAIAKLLVYYKWTTVAIIRSDDPNTGCDMGLSGTPKALKDAGIDATSFYIPFNDTNKIDQTLKETQSFTRG